MLFRSVLLKLLNVMSLAVYMTWLVPVRLTVPELCVKIPPFTFIFAARARVPEFAVKVPDEISKSEVTVIVVAVPPLNVP